MTPANRGVSGRFLPGASGNPTGRPKSFAAIVQAETKDGAELVAYMLGVLRNGKQPTALRMAAAQWLADRGFGRAVQTVEVDASVDATVTHVDGVRAEIRRRLTPDDADDITRRLLGH
jgi:Family of unknown function (DUF5681)